MSVHREDTMGVPRQVHIGATKGVPPMPRPTRSTRFHEYQFPTPNYTQWKPRASFTKHIHARAPLPAGGAISISAALKPSLKRAAAPSRDNASARRDPTRRNHHWSTRDSAFYTTGSRMIVFGTKPIRSQHPRPSMYSYVDQTPQTSTKMFRGFRT